MREDFFMKLQADSEIVDNMKSFILDLIVSYVCNYDFSSKIYV